MTVHLFCHFGSVARNISVDARGKPVVPLCGVDRFGYVARPADIPDCDQCLLLWSVARTNIGDEALRRPPFLHGGTPTLAPLFFAHRILGTEPVHFAWTRWTMSPAFANLQRYIVHGQIFVGCVMCGNPDAFKQHAGCGVCGAKR